jgi:glutaredoxin 3
MAHVRIYTLSGCPYCAQARALLTRYGRFEEVDATGQPEIRAWLKKVTGRTTLPQTFINGRPIGGASDLQALDESGRLGRMLSRR